MAGPALWDRGSEVCTQESRWEATQPCVGAYPLDVSAALSEDRKTLTFAVLNPSDSAQQLKLAINGAKSQAKATFGAWLRRVWTQASRWDKSLELKYSSKNSHRYPGDDGPAF